MTAALVLIVVSAGAAAAQNRSRNSRSSRDKLQRYHTRHQEMWGTLAERLEELARFCDGKHFPDAAARIRRLAQPAEPQALRVDLLPREMQPDIPRDISADERYWRVQLRHLQREYAKDLYLLSRQVLKAGYPSYAYRLVQEVAYHDPDHKAARRLLGYVRRGNEWVTPFAARMMARRYVWHEKFGWLRKPDVDEYEQGMRKFRGRWISAAQEAAIRRDFKYAWKVRTDHYEIQTNHSLERGVEVAVKLENFYRFFFQTFAGFFNSPEQLQQLFEGAGRGPRRGANRQPFEVHYYRNREEYITRLKPKIPQIAITNGLYYTTDRTAYFFENPDLVDDSTLYHEATHQLFYESELKERPIALKQNFWIIEGIACYMESFQHENGHFSLGDPGYIRFKAGRYRYLNDNYYVPLNRFTAMGMQEFQNDPNISKNYSQASNLAHFFMHYDNGRYRDALVEHLSQIYSASGRRLGGPQSLARLTGVSFGELDRQYGEYVKRTESALRSGE